MDLRQATNHLGLKFKGFPETPVTQTTYDQAVADGVLRDWRDGGGNAVSAPTWAELKAANVGGTAAAARPRLREAVEQSIMSGLSSNVLGATYLYPTDKETQANVHGLITAADRYPEDAPFHVWCAPASDPDDWKRRGHTDEQIKALGRVYVAHVAARQAQYESLLESVQAVVADFEAGNLTPDEAVNQINAIEWTEPGA